MIRHPLPSDLEATFDLLTRCQIPEYGLEGLREEWAEMDLGRQAWLAFAGAEGPIAYATATPYRSGLCYHVYIDPVWESAALFRRLLRACDSWARTQTQEPDETTTQTLITTWVAGGAAAERRALEEAGFSRVKRTIMMCRKMETRPPEPRLPVGVGIRCVVEGQDGPVLCDLMASLFAGTHLEPTSPEEWRDAMMGGAYFDADLWYVAVHQDEIIGACLCAVYPEVREAWVQQLGVARRWQRRGVGRALMLHAFRQFYDRGHRTVMIGVEAGTAGHRLYEQVGMETVRRYDEYQKRLHRV